MRSLKHWVTHNWHLKLVSVGLAAMLWMFVATEASSEIAMEVALENRNIPPQLEITGDTTILVQVRLRGSSIAYPGRVELCNRLLLGHGTRG